MSESKNRQAFTHFAVLHYGPGGKGTGYTIVTARNDDMARNYVWMHLSEKEDGYRQCSCRSLFEVMPLEDSIFADLQLPEGKVGVHCEYFLGESDEVRTPVLV